MKETQIHTNEVEAWELSTFFLQEFIERFLAASQLVKHVRQLRPQAMSSTYRDDTIVTCNVTYDGSAMTKSINEAREKKTS